MCLQSRNYVELWWLVFFSHVPRHEMCWNNLNVDCFPWTTVMFNGT